MNDLSELNSRLKAKKRFFRLLIPPFPKKNLLIEVTNFCNHSCVFCANSKMKRQRGFIDERFVSRILREAHDLGTGEVGLYATGEPLINKNIASYVKEAKNVGYSYVYITTNGALLTKERAAELIEGGVDSIKFSINAGTTETYKAIHGKDDFNTVINNLQFVSKYRKECKSNLRLFASCIVNKLNICEKELLQNEIKEYVDDIAFINVRNQGGLMYDETNKLMVDDDAALADGRVPCSMVFNSLTITHEGYLTACCVDFENYLIIADLNKMSLKDAWESEVFQNLRKRHLENNLKNTMCFNCLYNKKEPITPFVELYKSEGETIR